MEIEFLQIKSIPAVMASKAYALRGHPEKSRS
jgi:hypothetical protein